jgi:hypothetical protein
MDDSYEDDPFEDEDAEAEEMFRGPNDGAYEKRETRTGPPLDYVAEKFRGSMECTHYLIHLIKRTGSVTAEDKDTILSQARGALRYQLTGYLALKNMLALANDQELFRRLEGYSYDDFHDWLDRIDQQGTTTG